jgi:hypothetical protein
MPWQLHEITRRGAGFKSLADTLAGILGKDF